MCFSLNTKAELLCLASFKAAARRDRTQRDLARVTVKSAGQGAPGVMRVSGRWLLKTVHFTFYSWV